MDKIKEVQKMLRELSPGKVIFEDIGDNTVDNLMTELSRAASVELGKFVGALLNTNMNKFLQSYNMPEFEPFRAVMKDVISRYQIMSGSEQGDLFLKIENMFKDIFVDQFGHLGPEIAEMIAKKYSVQMVQFIKQYGVANKDMDIKKDGYY